MLGHIKHTLYLMLLLPFLAGCTDDLLADRLSADLGDELPIEFDFSMPAATRGFDGEVKRAFANGDVIHIIGTFRTKELQEDGKYKEGSVKRYGAMSYNGKQWNPLAGSKLTWPSVAVSGSFEAYYIYGSNGVLTGATEPKPVLLADVKPENGDPMHAESEEDIVYGHAVGLNFEHLCAYLTLVDLEPQVATSYWFRRENAADFNNAFKFYLRNDAGGDPEFVFEFCAEQANPKDFPGLVYISADAVAQTIFDENGEVKTITKANYFLQPGYYDTFSLCYPAAAPNVYDYLEYDYNNIPENSGGVGKENNKPQLDAGTTYTLTITKSPGITINSPSSGEGWHDGTPYYEVDVEEFLKAIAEKRKYEVTVEDEDGSKRTVTILEATADGTKLLENVDFRHFKYFNYGSRTWNFRDENFVPNISEGNVFDGDYHYIRNLASPLFRYNYGTIKNVGIRYITIEATTYEDEENYDDRDKDMSRLGALCMWNRHNAVILNVRVTGVEMDVTVLSQITTESDGSETHNIGCVVGSNTGSISEVALSGAFRLDVTGTDTNSSVLIGGLLGQNAAEGTVYDVTPLEGDLEIKMTNGCKGDLGSYSVGGVVGESTGTISGVILSDVTIDGTRSSGVTSYMGGIAGQLAASENVTTPTFVESCVIGGSIKAGNTVKYGAITSGSYIGSIAGADYNVAVRDCRTVVSVHGPATGNENVIYATGGGFGRIRDASAYVFENLIIYGSTLAGPNDPDEMRFIGNFAGIVPLGQTWENDYANKNILLRSLVAKNIGGNLDSSNNK